ncbi:MAG TPA: chorismate mutase [Candidatus Faeciplasma gallinarum]|uniref:Bifunctional chorismate mutase/prephenate dehydratase n=1 Tax=Candidatus Faeciplasma gallinarum TaxID=2840799 RepID=A0A9D1JI19_9FIRM|nr:chorismate mutase [Candidatus Faeciplasma gallinarum]
MDQKDFREQIDLIDDELVKLFAKRMEVSSKIAQFKKEKSLPVLDVKRERDKLKAVVDSSPDDIKEYTSVLYSLMFELSRSYQNKLIGKGTPLVSKIKDAIENTPKLFPEREAVACQGVEGAYSQIACDKLFKAPNVMYFSNFDAVFSAVEKGFCRYGVVPLENSTAGSVNTVYDLMTKHKFSIVRSIRLKVEHNLLAKPGTQISDIKEIYSHQQAISQCAGFLQSLKNVKIIPCENTAVAAKMVAESDRNDIATLSSRECMKLYGLSCLKASVQDKDNNYTRFICISKDLEIYPGADRTSLMAVLEDKPGSLYKLLSRLYALGINLNKLESRPMPEREFEFMFYFDLDTPVYSQEFLQLMGEIGDICEEFSYLGSYSEVI